MKIIVADNKVSKKMYAECRVTVTEAFELNWYPGFCTLMVNQRIRSYRLSDLRGIMKK